MPIPPRVSTVLSRLRQRFLNANPENDNDAAAIGSKGVLLFALKETGLRACRGGISMRLFRIIQDQRFTEVFPVSAVGELTQG
jgi:hypothetical protein